MSDREKKQKQVYEKPVIRIIDLAAEEVMAVGCKNISLSGPGGSHCIRTGGPPCFSAKS